MSPKGPREKKITKMNSPTKSLAIIPESWKAT